MALPFAELKNDLYFCARRGGPASRRGRCILRHQRGWEGRCRGIRRKRFHPTASGSSTFGRIPEWPNGADCKSAVFRLRWFESISAHTVRRAVASFRKDGSGALRRNENCGSSSVGRALAFQAKGRGFEPRLPLMLQRRLPGSGNGPAVDGCRRRLKDIEGQLFLK